jgi:hypothetical protein
LIVFIPLISHFDGDTSENKTTNTNGASVTSLIYYRPYIIGILFSANEVPAFLPFLVYVSFIVEFHYRFAYPTVFITEGGFWSFQGRTGSPFH